MKLILFIFFSVYSSYSFAQKEHNFKIEVKIKVPDGTKVYLTDTQGGGLGKAETAHIDSQFVSHGICVFYGTFKEIKYYSLAIDSLTNYAPFIIDPGTIVINANANDYLYKSLEVFSPQNNWKRIAQKIVDSLQKVRESMQDSLIKYTNKNEVLELTYSRKMDTIDLQTGHYLLFFLKSHPNSFFAFSELYKIYSYTKDVADLIKDNYDLFSDDIKNSEKGKYLYRQLTQSIETLIGKRLPDFYYYNIKNENVPLTLKGKYYLIDYWASWCGPCIANLPELRQLKNKFEKHGLKLISISFDLDSIKWKKSVKHNNIYWTNYRDINSFNSPDAKYFNITAIPFKVLINKEGLVILINPTLESVEEFLKQQK